MPQANSVRSRTRSARIARLAGLSDLDTISPDLPRLRTSERGQFKRCRWKWYLEFEEMLKPKTDIPALRFGSLIHKSLARYYPPGIKRGPHPAATFREEYQTELDMLEVEFGQRVRRDAEDDEVWVDAATLGEAMMNHYVERYGKDPQYKVIVTEQRFDVVVNHPIMRKPWFVYCGVIDGLWQDVSTGHVFIVDHKTAAAIMLKYLSLDDQATAYWTWGLDWLYSKGLIARDTKPAGMLYNIMRKAIKDDRPQNASGFYLNKDGSVSKKQPPDYFARAPIYRDWTERENARKRVFQEFEDIENVRRWGVKRAYKTPGQFTCPGCWAFDICELDEVGAPGVDEVKEALTRRWNPYHQREVYAGR